MNFLQLPLRVSPTGMLREITPDDHEIGRRLRIFLLLGMGEYDHDPHFHLAIDSRWGPAPATGRENPAKKRVRDLGIKALWEDLNRMGSSSRFHFLYTEDVLMELQKSITEKVNLWLDGCAVVLNTLVLGDEQHSNAVIFETASMKYHFEFALVKPGTFARGAIGPWNITEKFDAKP